MTAVKKVIVALGAILVWTAIPVVSANAVSIGQTCTKTALGTRVSIQVNKKPVVVVCRTVAGRKKWIRAAVQTLVTTTTSTSTTSTSSTSTTVPESVLNFIDAIDPIDPNLHTLTIENQRPRTYRLVVPDSYNSQVPTPILFAFHGLGGSAATFENALQLPLFSQGMNFILVTPNGWGSEAGSQNSWNAGRCCAPSNNNGIDDVFFVKAILQSVSRKYLVDSSRIWAMGFSNGGMMSYRLACEVSEKFSAIAVGGGALVVDSCSPPHPVSIIHLHGNQDSTIPIDGGGPFIIPPVINAFKQVNTANECSAMQFVVTLESNSESTSAICVDGTEAKLINYFDQAHNWPSYWTKDMIKFLFAHPRKP